MGKSSSRRPWAAANDRTVASRPASQVALRWLVENEQVLPIPGAKNARQAAENAGALSFSLSSEEIEALNQATLTWRVRG